MKFLKAVLAAMFGEYDTMRSLRNELLAHRTDGQANIVRDEGAQTILERTRVTEFADDGFLFTDLMEPHGYDPSADYSDYDTHVSIARALDAHSNPEETIAAYDAFVEFLADMYRELFPELRSHFE